MRDSIPLNSPCHYFPFRKGIYEVVPGLQPLGTDFGNGKKDSNIFQIDQEFHSYHQNKETCRKEGIKKYVHFDEFNGDISQKIVKFCLERLVKEYPKVFHLKNGKNNQKIFQNLLTKEELIFNKEFSLNSSHYLNAFDALAFQVQEDLAVWCLDFKSKRNWLSAIHLCAPNHWSPREKIGKDFRKVHAPVANNEKIIRPAPSLVEAMVFKGPFVRFVWGLATDRRLNHHPDPPKGEDQKEWRGRVFDPKNPTLFVRIERQTLFGFSKVGASLFTIRTYFLDCKDLSKNDQQKLTLAIKSMNEDEKKYKGLDRDFGSIINWLDQ